uniref:Cytochrome c oxidase subunit 3 n=1 Tax=Platencyrtus parkeri TaxID=752748 RepID=A0A7G5WI21_9HYME|nr:cytochrome c oxidase subunit III [Platencyrtus parkeri]
MKKLLNPFYLITLSPWPLLLSLSIMNFLISVVNWLNYKGFYMFYIMLLILLICLFQWWRDVIRESLFQGFHTFLVVKGLKMGMILFILSEFFFFFSIFWCYFHMFLSPSIEIGGIWPPANIKMFNPYTIPLINTVILLSSGVSITWCHYSLINSNFMKVVFSLLLTIILGVIFSLFQLYEYKSALFTFSDSVYGSIFYMSTGFHGLHVLVGAIFLMVSFIRILSLDYSKIHHFGFEAAVWYWHFVDVVWLFLYFFVYFWFY